MYALRGMVARLLRGVKLELRLLMQSRLVLSYRDGDDGKSERAAAGSLMERRRVGVVFAHFSVECCSY